MYYSIPAKKYMNNTTVVENLRNFVTNKGLVNKNRPPKINEPFYSEWIYEKIKRMNLKCGDELSITVRGYKEGKAKQYPEFSLIMSAFSLHCLPGEIKSGKTKTT